MSMFNNGTAAPAGEKPPWVQPGFIAAGTVVAVLVLLGLLLVLTGNHKSPATDAALPAPPPAARAPADPNASTCGLPSGSQSVPASAPRSKWELVGQVAAPTSPGTKGPGRVTGGLRSCFAHSPVGALYAAVNVLAMTGSDDLRTRFVKDMTVPGVGHDRALALASASPSSTDSAGTLQVAGFTFTDYRKRSAVIDLALRVDNGNASGYVHLPLALRWVEGDWKLALPDTGQPFDAMARIPDLTGYVSWRGA